MFLRIQIPPIFYYLEYGDPICVNPTICMSTLFKWKELHQSTPLLYAFHSTNYACKSKYHFRTNLYRGRAGERPVKLDSTLSSTRQLWKEMMEPTRDVNFDNIYPVTDWRQTECRGSREFALEHLVRGGTA
jgi:hypothetical protein